MIDNRDLLIETCDFTIKLTVKQESSELLKDLVETGEDEMKHSYLFCLLPFFYRQRDPALPLLIELLLVERRGKRDDEIGDIRHRCGVKPGGRSGTL